MLAGADQVAELFDPLIVRERILFVERLDPPGDALALEIGVLKQRGNAIQVRKDGACFRRAESAAIRSSDFPRRRAA